MPNLACSFFSQSIASDSFLEVIKIPSTMTNRLSASERTRLIHSQCGDVDTLQKGAHQLFYFSSLWYTNHALLVAEAYRLSETGYGQSQNSPETLVSMGMKKGSEWMESTPTPAGTNFASISIHPGELSAEEKMGFEYLIRVSWHFIATFRWKTLLRDAFEYWKNTDGLLMSRGEK